MKIRRRIEIAEAVFRGLLISGPKRYCVSPKFSVPANAAVVGVGMSMDEAKVVVEFEWEAREGEVMGPDCEPWMIGPVVEVQERFELPGIAGVIERQRVIL